MSKQSLDTHRPLGLRNSLGHAVCKLSSGCNLLQRHMSILDGLIREVLADVNVFGAFATSNDIVSPLNACSVVLVHRCRAFLKESHVAEQLAEVDDLL